MLSCEQSPFQIHYKSVLLLLLNIFDDVPVCRRVTAKSWVQAVRLWVSEMQVSKDEYTVTV